MASRKLSIDNGGRNDHLQMETVEERDEDHVSSFLPALSPRVPLEGRVLRHRPEQWPDNWLVSFHHIRPVSYHKGLSDKLIQQFLIGANLLPM